MATTTTQTTSATAPRHYETIILGAGMAGLACASKLLEHPHYRASPVENRLLVLEGRNRIGGRIHSVHVNGHRLDVGANWIHGVGTDEGAGRNPLVDILPDKRVKLVDGAVVFKTDGHEKEDLVVPRKFAGPLMASLWSCLGMVFDAAERMPVEEAKHTSVLDALTKSEWFRDVFKILPEEYHRTFQALPQFLEVLEAAPLVAASAEQDRGRKGMSLLEFAGEAFDGDQVFLQDGFVPVVETVGRAVLDAGLVELEKEVKKVQWSGKAVRVETKGEVFTADRVVCTLPLGVLQHDADSEESIFEPRLPEDKTEAIESLGFGALDKIITVYSKAWWNEEPYLSILKKGQVNQPYYSTEIDENVQVEDTSSPPDMFLGSTHELAGLEMYSDGTSSPGLRILSVMNLHSLTDVPALSAYVSCANARHIESLTDDEAGEIVHRTLTRWLGQEVPRPDVVHVSRWAQDEFARGSYSHMITGSSELGHRECFVTPTIGEGGAVVRFAGEHTMRDHFGTVHGALLSGWREAEEILKEVQR